MSPSLQVPTHHNNYTTYQQHYNLHPLPRHTIELENITGYISLHIYCSCSIYNLHGETERLVEVHDGVLHSIHLFHQPHDVIRQLPADIDHVVGRQQERLYGSLVVDVERDVDGIAVPPQDGSLDLPHGTRGGEG